MRDVEPPEERPEFPVQRMHPGMTRHHATIKGPAAPFFDQVRADGVGQDVEIGPGKNVPLPFLLAQNVVMRLMLPFPTITQSGSKFGSEKLHRVELIATAPHPHPEKVQVVGHQAVRRTPYVVADRGMEHQLAESVVKSRRQLTAGPLFERKGPEDDGAALIMMPFQTRQIAFGDEGHAVL